MTTPWDDPTWKERDTPWAAGCRWLQSWWRSEELGLAPGPHKRSNPDRLVASMLPLDAPRGANFLTEPAATAAFDRLAEPGGSGIIEEDRLVRNLLSSQPACFNLFGPFVDEPNRLLPWVQRIDAEATSVSEVRFEWAPPKAEHFGGGSAFDAFVAYRAGEAERFLGVECKYAENLAASPYKPRDVHGDWTTPAHGWRDDALDRLQARHRWQLWLNTLLAQSLVAKDQRWDDGTAVVVACAADEKAKAATDEVRVELDEPDRWLRWSPYEDVLTAVGDAGPDGWANRFRRRYLDFTPVAHLLASGDSRRRQPGGRM